MDNVQVFIFPRYHQTSRILLEICGEIKILNNEIYLLYRNAILSKYKVFRTAFLIYCGEVCMQTLDTFFKIRRNIKLQSNFPKLSHNS